MQPQDLKPQEIKIINLENGQLIPLYKDSHLIVQTDYVYLEKYPFLTKFSQNDWLYLFMNKEYDRAGKDKPNNKPLLDIFDMFKRLDTYSQTENLASTIIGFNTKMSQPITYYPVVRGETKKYPYLKFKLNYEMVDEKPKLKVFYKSQFNTLTHKYYSLDELRKILDFGTSIRFILKINKIWANNINYGYGVRIVQMEIKSNILVRPTYKTKLLLTKKETEKAIENIIEKTDIINVNKKQTRQTGQTGQTKQEKYLFEPSINAKAKQILVIL